MNFGNDWDHLCADVRSGLTVQLLDEVAGIYAIDRQGKRRLLWTKRTARTRLDSEEAGRSAYIPVPNLDSTTLGELQEEIRRLDPDNRR